MAARFPQGSGNLAYRIKPAWSSKIHVLYWAVEADKLQRLRSGDTVTSQVTRAASGCTFDATNGVIAGNNSTRFTDSIAGGFGGLQENSNFVAGASWLGDVFNSGTGGTIGLSSAAATSTGSSFLIGSVNSYTIEWRLLDGSGNNSPGSPFSDDTVGWMTLAARFDQADATAKIRAWGNGSEFDGKRTNGSTGNTSKLGDTGRPLYIGDSYTGTGNTRMHFEFAFLAAVLSDADMATITSDPASILEVAESGDPPDPPTIGSVTSVTGTGATINWADESSDETGFKVEVGVSVGGTVSVWSSASGSPAAEDAESLAITGLSPSTTYRARVAATNASGDSAWQQTAEFTTLTRKLKVMVEPAAASADGIAGVVFAAPDGGAITGAKIGEFTGKSFAAETESGKAVLKVPVADFGGGALSLSDHPVILVRNSTYTTGIISADVSVIDD